MIQMIVTYHCPKCDSKNIVKNGHNYKGAQKYHCHECKRYGTLQAQQSYDESIRQQIQQAVLERVSLRGVERVFPIARQTVSRWIRQWAAQLPPLATTLVEAQANDILELDELCSFVYQKRNKRWVFVALCRRTRQIVAYYIGDRSAASC